MKTNSIEVVGITGVSEIIKVNRESIGEKLVKKQYLIM